METVKIIKFNPALCKGYRDCERACSKVHFKEVLDAAHSAIHIHKAAAASKAKEAGKAGEAGKTGAVYRMTNCNHCGLCIDLCPVLALKRTPKGNVILNKKTCVGCLSCVGFCPRGVMRLAPGTDVPFKCISCGLCVAACPEGALELVEIPIAEVEEEVYARLGVSQ